MEGTQVKLIQSRIEMEISGSLNYAYWQLLGLFFGMGVSWLSLKAKKKKK